MRTARSRTLARSNWMKPAFAFCITFLDGRASTGSGRLARVERLAGLRFRNSTGGAGPLAADRFRSRATTAGPLRKSSGRTTWTRRTSGPRWTTGTDLAGCCCRAHALRPAGTLLIRLSRLAGTGRKSLALRRRCPGWSRGSCWCSSHRTPCRWTLCGRRTCWSRGHTATRRRNAGSRRRSRMCRMSRVRCRRTQCSAGRRDCGRCTDWTRGRRGRNGRSGSSGRRSQRNRCRCRRFGGRWSGWRRRWSRPRGGLGFHRRRLRRFRCCFRRREALKMLPRQFRVLDIDRARVRLLFLDADRRQKVDQHLGLDLELAGQLV